MNKNLYRVKVNTKYRYSIFADNRNQALMILLERYINENPEIDIKDISIQEIKGLILNN